MDPQPDQADPPSSTMEVDGSGTDYLPEQRGLKRSCEGTKCDFAERKKRHKSSSAAVCIPSQSLGLQLNALKGRVAKLELENCDLEDELDRLHCVSRMRYRQVQHLECVVQKLCQFANIDFSDQDFSDPDYFSPFRVLPPEVVENIVSMVDRDSRRSLKRVCQWWNQVTKESTTCLAVRCPGGMRGLIGYPRLKSLNISTMHINEAHYQGGKYMLNLTKIGFYQVTSIPFHILAQLPYLTSLEIRNSEMASMEGLDTLTMLEELSLDSVISSFAFPVSACHPKLRRLSIVECFCIRVQTRFLGCCKNLEYMHIDSSLSAPINDISFVRNTPHLKHFAIAACCGENLSAFSLEPLASLRNLEYVNLKGICEADYSPLFELESIKRFVPGIVCDEEFVGLMRGMKSAKGLESIELSDNEELTDDSLALLPSLCPNVYRILIFDCLSVTQEAVKHLKRLQHLTCLQLSPEIWWGNFSNIDEWKALCCNVCLDDL